MSESDFQKMLKRLVAAKNVINEVETEIWLRQQVDVTPPRTEAAPASTQQEPDDETALTTKQVASLLDCGEKKVQRLAREGKLKPIPGSERRLRFTQAEVNRYLNNEKRRGRPPR